MNHLELQALRRFLFFSVPEAALLVAASPERINGVQERTWRRWEDGTLVVPQNIADTMLELCRWRAQELKVVREAGCKIILIWYPTLEGWNKEPIFWRPYCSVVAESITNGARVAEWNTTLEKSTII